MRRILALGLALALTTGLMAGVAAAKPDQAGPPQEVRFATFNASLNRFNAGDLAAELSAPGSAQPDVIAEIIQRVRPDVLLINEFDFDAGGVALAGFQTNYLSLAHGTAAPIVSRSSITTSQGFVNTTVGLPGMGPSPFLRGTFSRASVPARQLSASAPRPRALRCLPLVC